MELKVMNHRHQPKPQPESVLKHGHSLLWGRMRILIGTSFLLMIAGLYTQRVSGAGLLIRERLTMYSAILTQDVHFSVCLPVNYFAESKSYPVVYLLHGLGDDETSWLEYGRIKQYARQSEEAGQSVPMIFIMPEGFRSYYVNQADGSFRYLDMFVNELVPYIDSLFRTLPDRRHRALMGYSMGGFGAMMLHLKHPETFGATVPLSTSVRSDQQYIAEDASGWDEQWGRIFGGKGLEGHSRLTDYYRQNSPFHVIPELTKPEIHELNIYMLNGDEEQTLCKSNEELHLLMLKNKVPHEYRVTDGGHSFAVWRAALPGALQFLSDFFKDIPYRGESTQPELPTQDISRQLIQIETEAGPTDVFVPGEYAVSDRKYPVLYCIGDFSLPEKLSISNVVNHAVETNNIAPVIVVFLNETDTSNLKLVISRAELLLRIRPGYRFRAVSGYGSFAYPALQLATHCLRFSSCLLWEMQADKDIIANMCSEDNLTALKRMTILCDASDSGSVAEANSAVHMLLRENQVEHEYRVRDGNGGFTWLLGGLPYSLSLISARFHR